MRRRHDWMAQATSYSQDPEDIALICKSERYGFCIESSDRIPNGYDASFRYDAILFLSLSLSLAGKISREMESRMAARYI